MKNAVQTWHAASLRIPIYNFQFPKISIIFESFMWIHPETPQATRKN